MATRLNIRNLPWLRTNDRKTAEAFDDVVRGHTNVAQQLATDPGGADVIPPQISSVEAVHLGSGHIDVAITDNAKIFRAISYFIEYDTSENFTNPRVVSLGPSRNAAPFVLPNGTYFFRAYSQYPAGGPPSNPVNAGSVTVTGSSSGTLLGSQASGTAHPATGGGAGAGKVLQRS